MRYENEAIRSTEAEAPIATKVAATSFTYALNLIQADPATSQPQVRASGTIQFASTGEIPPIGGIIQLPAIAQHDITFEGTTSQTASGTVLVANGGSPEVSVDLTIAFAPDDFLFTGNYLGGLMSVLDFGQEETFLYILQGIAPAAKPEKGP